MRSSVNFLILSYQVDNNASLWLPIEGSSSILKFAGISLSLTLF